MHPAVGWLVIAFLVVWTAFVVWAYRRRRGVPRCCSISDLVVAVAAIGISPYVKGEGLNATLPGFWVMGVVLAWAIMWRWQGGLVAALAVIAWPTSASATSSPRRPTATSSCWSWAAPSWASCPGCSSRRQPSATARSGPPQRPRSASGWREWSTTACSRCSRWCSGGRRSWAPTDVELGQARRRAGGAAARAGAAGLARPAWHRWVTRTSSGCSRGCRRPHVHVAVPGSPAMLPAERASEVIAAVEACLSNVRHHVGREAEAWVLLEELEIAWVVSVRDDGPGIAEGRLEASAAEGRLGVQQSIVGRLHDLGGVATVRSAPGQGTEWELDGAAAGHAGGPVTIHTEHPFLDPDADPVRRLRGRLGGAVTLWTSGSERSRAGLTVSSVMVAGGEPGRVLGLVDPDSDFRDVLEADRAGRRTAAAVGAPRPGRGVRGAVPGPRRRRSGWGSGSRPRTVRGSPPSPPGPRSTSSRRSPSAGRTWSSPGSSES